MRRQTVRNCSEHFSVEPNSRQAARDRDRKLFNLASTASDGDGAPRAQSTASDGDGAPLAQSTASDGDGAPLAQSTASDGDGAP